MSTFVPPRFTTTTAPTLPKAVYPFANNPILLPIASTTNKTTTTGFMRSSGANRMDPLCNIWEMLLPRKVALSHFRMFSSTVYYHFNSSTSRKPATGKFSRYSWWTHTSRLFPLRMCHVSSGSGGPRKYWAEDCFRDCQARYRTRSYAMLGSFR